MIIFFLKVNETSKLWFESVDRQSHFLILDTSLTFKTIHTMGTVNDAVYLCVFPRAWKNSIIDRPHCIWLQNGLIKQEIKVSHSLFA